MPNEPSATGELIRTKRLAAGLTQEQFAEALGVTQTAVSLWETGTNEPTVTNYRRIAQALDVDLAALLEPVVATGPAGERYVAEG